MPRKGVASSSGHLRVIGSTGALLVRFPQVTEQVDAPHDGRPGLEAAKRRVPLHRLRTEHARPPIVARGVALRASERVGEALFDDFGRMSIARAAHGLEAELLAEQGFA